MRWRVWRVHVVLGVLAAVLVFGVSGALADDFHGIAVAKQCTSPVKIGDPYTCSVQMLNILDTAHDTLRVTGLSDVVSSAGGAVATGNILPTVGLIFGRDPNAGGPPDPVSCTGGSGAGTAADPYMGAAACLLQFGGTIQTKQFSHYTVQAADFALPEHKLNDSATVAWNNTCTAPSANCTTGPQSNSAGASALVEKLSSSTATNIHNAADQTVTVVAVGTTVHDFVTVTGQPERPVPTGKVNIDWFLNGACSGPPAANSGSVGPLVNGQFDAAGFAFTPPVGHFAFQAHYEGDATYTASVGACEPLTVVDANIQLTPPTATNRVGTNHVLTCHVNVNEGNGFANAPAGTVCTVEILSGPGAPASQQCSTVGTSGDCQVTISSSVTGQTTLRARTTVDVGGVSLHRETGDGHAGDSPDAQKLWVNASIAIAPNATNEVGAPHTFTATLLFDTGSGFAPAGANQPVTITLTNGGGAVANPAGPFNLMTNAAGQIQVTFTSATAGTVTGHASWTGSVAGSGLFTVATSTGAPNGADAVKTFVDANIQITPNGVNRVGQTHTFTAHVNVNNGSGSFVPAPAGTGITFSKLSGPGGFTPASATCATVGTTGSCTVDLSSATTGVTTVRASTNVTVGGVTLHRATGDTHSADSADATKTWVNAKISIAPNATNEVGAPHTFTATLQKDTGTGTFAAAAGEAMTITLDGASGAVPNPAGPFNCTTNAAGQCQVTFTSATGGTVKGHATSTLSVAGSAAFTVATDAQAPNSGDAVKTFVDANIEISPPASTNPVGTNHTLIAHVNVDNGSGSFVSAPADTVINFSLENSAGATAEFVNDKNSCKTVGDTGSCDVAISSPTPGLTAIRAKTDVTVGGVSLHRETGDSHDGDGKDALKNWASARITIVPNETHEVGQPHTFTVTLEKDTGTGAFAPAADEHVDVALTNALGANHTDATGTCTNTGANTDANGQCTITLTSPTSGTVTAHATSTLSVEDKTITVATNGQAGNSGDAVATFVDANVQISPNATNPVGKTHTFTAHVNVNAGNGAGFVNAPDATSITFTLDSGPGTFTTASPCATAGGTGSCTIGLVSSVTGTSVVSAHVKVAVDGVTLARDTNGTGANSVPATKLWADDTVRTDVLRASTGEVVTTAVAGTVVHDEVFVAKAAGTPDAVPNPTGSVVFHRFATLDCTGTATNQTVALTAGSPSTAVTDDFAPTANTSYQAEYLGDANYPAHTGACEPLTVTPAPAPAIAIVKNPKSQTVAVGGTATFSITVTNVGNTVLTNVTVTDPLSPNCNRSQAQIPALASMDPGAAVTYTCTRPNVRAAFDNVATATGTPPSGPNVTATDTAPVKARALKKPVKKHKKKPKVVSHKKPKATG